MGVSLRFTGDREVEEEEVGVPGVDREPEGVLQALSVSAASLLDRGVTLSRDKSQTLLREYRPQPGSQETLQWKIQIY